MHCGLKTKTKGHLSVSSRYLTLCMIFDKLFQLSGLDGDLILGTGFSDLFTVLPLWYNLSPFLSIVLPRNIKKIKVRYIVFVVPIKCTLLGFYCKKTWIFIVVKRGFSWPFQSGIFIHFGPNEVLMNHRRRALPYIDTISYVTKFYIIQKNGLACQQDIFSVNFYLY